MAIDNGYTSIKPLAVLPALLTPVHRQAGIRPSLEITSVAINSRDTESLPPTNVSLHLLVPKLST